MRGSSERWDPACFLHETHPEVRVIDTRSLPGRVQGCVDHEQRIIWLDAGLSPTSRRATLAYEVAQFQQGPTPEEPCLAAAHQRDAAEWAARMLIDSEALCEAFEVGREYHEIAALLHVDVPTVRARLRAMTDAEQDAVFAAILRQRLSA